jgi:hypothetical protein
VIAQAAIAVGVLAPVGVVVAVAAIVGAWQGFFDGQERRNRHADLRRRVQREASVLRREASLRRQRDIRLGRLDTNDRFGPVDDRESVRVIRPPQDQSND